MKQEQSQLLSGALKPQKFRTSSATRNVLEVARLARFGALFMLVVLIVFNMMFVTGCGAPSGPVFEPLDNPIVWPPPPAEARIEYVGTLATDRDLNPPRSLAKSIGQILFGKDPPREMTAPYSIVSDGDDRVFICDSARAVVHVFNLRTRRYEKWDPIIKNGEESRRFIQPIGLCWHPDGRLYVADAGLGTIFAFDKSGSPVGEIGVPHVTRPCGMAIDPKRGLIFVADPAQHQVIVMNERGDLICAIGRRGIGEGEFNFPTDVAIDSVGRLYVSDSLNFRVQVFDTTTPEQPTFVRQIGRRGNTPGHFSQPKGLAVDSEDHLYVVDAHFETVQIFDSLGRLLLYFGSEGTGPGEFWIPAGMYVDRQDRIWIADTYNRRVQVFQYLPDTRSIAEAKP